LLRSLKNKRVATPAKQEGQVVDQRLAQAKQVGQLQRCIAAKLALHKFCELI
jgi:hypothetical protein